MNTAVAAGTAGSVTFEAVALPIAAIVGGLGLLGFGIYKIFNSLKG
jgi:hypothetical protein